MLVALLLSVLPWGTGRGDLTEQDSGCAHRELGFPEVFWHYRFLYTMYPACLVNIFRPSELDFSHRLKIKKSLKLVWMVHNCERHTVMSLQVRLLIPSGFSAMTLSVDNKYLTGSQVSWFVFLIQSSGEKRLCFKYKNMSCLDLEENLIHPCLWIKNSKAVYVLQDRLWAIDSWPCWCVIETFINVTVPKGFMAIRIEGLLLLGPWLDQWNR